MIANATKDGRVRAEKVVENAGGRLAKLRYSNVGVFQITQPNLAEEYSCSRKSRKDTPISLHLCGDVVVYETGYDADIVMNLYILLGPNEKGEQFQKNFLAQKSYYA